MGFRFRRSVKIIPGVRINFSNSGVSTSVGVRGAHVTIGHGKVRETVGIPGTGLSYTEVQSTKPGAHESVAAPPLSDDERLSIRRQIFWALVLIAAFAVLVQVFTAFTTY
jgi:hypothetical protein